MTLLASFGRDNGAEGVKLPIYIYLFLGALGLIYKKGGHFQCVIGEMNCFVTSK